MEAFLRLLSACTVILWLAVPDTVQSQVSTGQRLGEIGEAPDIALRRAQAFHDMYAGEEEKKALASKSNQYLSASPGSQQGKPLPLNYPSRSPAARLRIMQDLAPAGRYPGAEYKIAPTALSVLGTNWHNIGPVNFGGRVSSLAIHPGNPSTIYRGTAGGGLWKSTNAGSSWIPLTDSLGALSIGAVAVAPSNPKIVYVGTGEGTMGIDGIDGLGFISSPDGGVTWTLPKSIVAPRFFDLSVHPTRTGEILAGTSVGVLKTIDGGSTWTSKLEGVFGTSLVRVPGRPDTILATTWDASSAQASWTGSIFRSTDGGESWQNVGGAGVAPFPANTGRLSLAISSVAPFRVFVLGASANGDTRSCERSPVDQIGIFSSGDLGSSWTFKSNPVSGSCPTSDEQAGYISILGGQGWYGNTIIVVPNSSNVLYAGGVDLWKSVDGGATWIRKSRWDSEPSEHQYMHADVHALVFSGPKLYIGNDGGVSSSTNGGGSFSESNTGVVTRQLYSVGGSSAEKELVLGGAQDNGTNLRIGSTYSYKEVIGGDGFAVAVHPANPALMYGTIYSSRIFRSTDHGETFNEVSPTYSKDETLPFITPLAMDQTNPSVLYTGSNFLWKTVDGGDTWSRTSNTDLGDGGRTGYITSIALSSSDPNMILVATGAGIVSKSVDGGKTWARCVGLPNAYASHVEIDPVNSSKFYVSFMTVGPGNRVFKTLDGGLTFSVADYGLSETPVHIVRADPKLTDTLYAGTDFGLFRSLDGGGHWAKFGTGLPAVSVWDIAISADSSSMRIATHGRGFFELEVVGPPLQ